MTNANKPMATLRAEISGMKVHCDSCGYDIENVSFEELAEYVGYECPECGANMLTENDYTTAMMLIAFVNNTDASVEEKLNRYMKDIKPGHRHIRVTDETHSFSATCDC